VTTHTLAQHLSSHRNNFALLRLFAAWLVLFGHSYPLVLATPEHPHITDPISQFFYAYLGFGQSLSGMGVCLFFFVSGLLVTKSYVQRDNARAFLRSRAARIFPALLVNLLFCALVIGAIATTLPLNTYLFHSGIHQFITHNLLLWQIQFELPAVFQTLPWQSVNGSLWTLPLEVRMYLWCLAFGICGILNHRATFNAVMLVAFGLFLMQGKGFFLGQEGTDFLWIYFLLGMATYLNAEYLRLDLRILLVLLALTACFHGVDTRLYDMCFALTFSYAVLYAAYARYLPALDVGRLGDFSYGTYLYAYPVQQLLVQLSDNTLSPLMLCAATTATVLPLAVLSWVFIEKPALRRFRS
jgi:peptidoglycan/LPS O-acetylase OafA/YrhL